MEPTRGWRLLIVSSVARQATDGGLELEQEARDWLVAALNKVLDHEGNPFGVRRGRGRPSAASSTRTASNVERLRLVRAQVQSGCLLPDERERTWFLTCLDAALAGRPDPFGIGRRRGRPAEHTSLQYAAYDELLRRSRPGFDQGKPQTWMRPAKREDEILQKFGRDLRALQRDRKEHSEVQWLSEAELLAIVDEGNTPPDDEDFRGLMPRIRPARRA